MTSLKTFITKYPVASYFALTFAISWGGALLAIGGSGGMRGTTPASDPRFVYALMAMLAGPSVTGLLLTGLVHGRSGLREFLSRLSKWRVGANWYLVALLTPPFLMTATLLALSLASPAFLPGVFTSDQKAPILVVGLAVGLAAGIFEEVGWTGFAIPRVRLRYGVLATGLLVGVSWSAWHLLPNIWAIRASAGELAVSIFLSATLFGVFVGYLTAFRVLMVWVYERTESLLIAIVMHASFTASLLILNPLGISGANLLTYSLSLAAAVWLVVAAVALVNSGRLSSRPLRRQAGSTPAFRGPRGEPLPGSIAEIDYLPLGGLEQFVMIRGERVTNPPLIILHGGPGFSDTQFFRHCNAALEKSFTVVYWDQRGTGKSYYRSIPRSSMTVQQFIADLDALVEAVRTRVGQDQVAIFGHSWGSALGVLYAARFPEKVAAYVGCEQVGDSQAAEAASYGFALAEAQRLNHRKALKELRAIGPPPYRDARSLFTERTWLSRFEGQLRPRALWNMGRLVLGTPESSIFDLPNIVRGFRFSLDAMWTEVSKLNLVKLAPVLQMPVFFFLGRRDRWVPPETSLAYFEALTAPSKKLVWFEKSGHEPFVDEPDRFNAAMVELVRPALMSRASLIVRTSGAA